jgi:hypothetical protein
MAEMGTKIMIACFKEPSGRFGGRWGVVARRLVAGGKCCKETLTPSKVAFLRTGSKEPSAGTDPFEGTGGGGGG